VYLKQEQVEHCCPEIIELVFNGIRPAMHSFQVEDRFCFLQLGKFSCAEEIHGSLKWKSCMLDDAASSILLPVRIVLGFQINTSCNLSVSKWRLALCAPNSPFQVSQYPRAQSKPQQI
jgi:hypothetical protein